MAAFAKIRVSPAKRFWRGQPKTRPFQLFVKPEGGLPITLDGTLLQESVLPPWFLKALLAIVALAHRPRPDLAAAPQADHPDGGVGGRGLAAREPQGGRQRRRSATPACPRWRRRRRRRRRRGPDRAPDRAPDARRPATPPTPGARRRRRPRPRASLIPGLGNPVDGRLDVKTTSVPVKGTLFVTDLVFSNPNGAKGAVVVLRDTDQLLQLRLDNFRDYDLHFVTPIVFQDGQSLNLSLSCTSAPCDPAVFYSGYLRP